MATPIIEYITANLAATINAITIAAGYTQTLTAVRSRRVDFSDITAADGMVYLAQTLTEDPSYAIPNCLDWEQGFELGIFVLDNDAATNSIDTRINQLRSDVEKALMADITRGGYAYDTLIQAPTAWPAAETWTGISVNITVKYRTPINDPYSGVI